MTNEVLAVSLKEVEQRAKSNTHRIGEVEKRQDSLDKLVTSVEVLATRQGNMESDVEEIKKDVKILAEKPGKRWEGLVDKLILAVAGGIVGFLLGALGMGG